MTEQLATSDQQSTANHTPASVVPGLWRVPCLLMLLALLCIITIDAPLGHWIQELPPIKPLRVFLEAAEHFGTPAGQFLLLLALGWSGRRTSSGELTPQWDVRSPRIYTGALVAGLAANVFKLCITRTRPRAFDFEQSTIWESFGNLFPFGAGGSNIQSFPSAHTACAVGFAVILGWAWPERRRIFYLLAALVGMQRLISGAHFPSDVLAGAAVGWLCAQLYVRDCLVFRWWSRQEDRMKRWQQTRQAGTP